MDSVLDATIGESIILASWKWKAITSVQPIVGLLHPLRYPGPKVERGKRGTGRNTRRRQGSGEETARLSFDLVTWGGGGEGGLTFETAHVIRSQYWKLKQQTYPNFVYKFAPEYPLPLDRFL
jgi:hypothetical protein